MIISHFLPIYLLNSSFMPHGTCYLWKPSLVGLHLGSNAMIALSYFSIPLTLLYLVGKRRDLPFNSIFFLFSAFIISCGLCHFMDIWTLWYPNYWISGTIRAVTAIASLITAIVLINLINPILNLPSPSQLSQEIEERKQAENALKESQRRLKAIFNQTYQLMGLLNPNGTIVSLNQTALDFTNLTSEEIENRPFWQLSNWHTPPDMIKAAIQSVHPSQDYISYEYELRGVNQTLATFDWSFKPLLDEFGKIELIIAEGRDISQRKQAEAKLQQLNSELEERVGQRTQALEDANQLKEELLNRERISKTKIKIYEDIVLSIPIGLTIWHLEDLEDANSFRLIDVNPEAIELLQLNRQEHIGKRMIECFPNIWSDTHNRATEMYAEVVQTGHIQKLDNLIYGDNRIGTFYFDVKAFPLPNQCVGIAFENITQRKHIEKALVESTRRYRQVINSVNEVIFQLNKVGNWTFLNPAWTKITGYTVIESLERPFTNYIANAAQKTNIQHQFELLMTGEIETLQIEFQSYKKGGAFCWLEMKGQLYQKGDTDEKIGVLGILTDITARKKAQMDLQERAKELTHLNTLLFTATAQLEKRNQELDQFAYVASHDLKAPLRAIANLSEWIAEDLEDHLNEETAHHINLLQGRVQRMENLINGLLEYSRIGRLKSSVKMVNVRQLLQEIIESLDLPDSFTINIIEPMPTLTTELLPLQQVFSNLVSNAIKHHPRLDGKVEIYQQEKDNYYEFYVKDDGQGIDPDYHQRIFEIFQTLTPRDQKENTGIGLAIVKKIIENQGGTIRVESNIGEGAVFAFTWPKTHP